MNIDTITWHL